MASSGNSRKDAVQAVVKGAVKGGVQGGVQGCCARLCSVLCFCSQQPRVSTFRNRLFCNVNLWFPRPKQQNNIKNQEF